MKAEVERWTSVVGKRRHQAGLMRSFSRKKASPGRSRRWSPPAAASRAKRGWSPRTWSPPTCIGHDSHGIGMMPRYIEALLEGGLHANQHPKVDARRRRAARARRLQGLRPDDRPGGDGDGDRAREEARHLRHGARPIRTTSAASGIGPRWRWPQGLVSMHFVNVISRARRRAVRRRRRALRHQPGVHRHPAARRAAVRARHGDQRGGAGQDARGAQQAREGAARLADRRPGQARPTTRAAAWCSRSARCSPSAGTRATDWRWPASCSAAR